jgi:hypothetical protein
VTCGFEDPSVPVGWRCFAWSRGFSADSALVSSQPPSARAAAPRADAHPGSSSGSR